MSTREIIRADILGMGVYGAERKQRRAEISALKERRRLAVGPFASIHFECYETMWMQIHEMLYIEKGGEEQIADELAAYNPLIPDGRELVLLSCSVSPRARAPCPYSEYPRRHRGPHCHRDRWRGYRCAARRRCRALTRRRQDLCGALSALPF